MADYFGGYECTVVSPFTRKNFTDSSVLPLNEAVNKRISEENLS